VVLVPVALLALLAAVLLAAWVGAGGRLTSGGAAGSELPRTGAGSELPRTGTLQLDDLWARRREWANEIAEVEARGNDIRLTALLKAQNEEFDRWDGRTLEGVANVWVVESDCVRLGPPRGGLAAAGGVVLVRPEDLPDWAFLRLIPKSRADPLLAALSRGDRVKFRGRIAKYRDANKNARAFFVDDCTLAR
jgi:hypothetical protein